MDYAFAALVFVVVLALAFDFINGFHDTANAVATVVSTGVLPLRSAIGLAAMLNLVGALTGTAVASTIGKGIIDPSAISQGVVLAALVGAIVWNLITWYYGIPSSSSHALVGGLLGAGISHAGLSTVHWDGFLKIVKSLIISPLVGLFVAFWLMILIFWLSRRSNPMRANRRFRWLQMVSSGFMAFSHGSNDAQKSMGIITMSLAAYGAVSVSGDHFPVPYWVVLSCAIAMAAGTASGGVRIIKTMGTKIIDLRPIHGFAAETSAACTILTASHLGLPVSTTHVISGAILGVGASQRISAVRWGVSTKILWAWVFTIPMTSLIAAVCYSTLHYTRAAVLAW